MRGVPGIRDISTEDYDRALQIMRQLRPSLDKTTFLQHLTGQSGYRLIGSYTPNLSGLIGMRVVETLARGRFMHVDDLVVAETFRDQGVGRALLSFAEAEARRLDCGVVFLDSYEDVLPFYRKLGYISHNSTLVHKTLT
ncbi:MAG: GNAT family N-acetyltransferase [Gammaproteobacteria bacterium]